MRYFSLLKTYIINDALFIHIKTSVIETLIGLIIGTILGWILFQVLKKIFFKAKNNTLTFKLEPYVYIIIAITFAFLG